MAEGEPGPALRPARREARVAAFAVDMLVLAALAPGFAALGGLTVLLQTGWLDVDPTGREWAWGYAVSGLWLVTPWLYFTLGTSRGGTVGARLLGLSVRDRRRRALGPRRAARGQRCSTRRRCCWGWGSWWRCSTGGGGRWRTA